DDLGVVVVLEHDREHRRLPVRRRVDAGVVAGWRIRHHVVVAHLAWAVATARGEQGGDRDESFHARVVHHSRAEPCRKTTRDMQCYSPETVHAWYSDSGLRNSIMFGVVATFASRCSPNRSSTVAR